MFFKQNLIYKSDTETKQKVCCYCSTSLFFGELFKHTFSVVLRFGEQVCLSNNIQTLKDCNFKY